MTESTALPLVDSLNRIIQIGDFVLYTPSTRGNDIYLAIVLGGVRTAAFTQETSLLSINRRPNFSLGKVKIKRLPAFRVTTIEDFLPAYLVEIAYEQQRKIINSLPWLEE